MAGAANAASTPRRILLATDLSGRCDRALDRSALLSRQWKSGLLALHVLEDAAVMTAWHKARGLPLWHRPPDALQVAESHLRSCLVDTPEQITTLVEEGEPAAVIARVASEQRCELVVTGTARNERLGRWFVGSTVSRLVQTTRISVLVVKSRPRAPYGRIVVATDFSDSSRHALKAALAWFAGVSLTLFNAYDVPLSGLASDPRRLREDYRAAIAEDCAAFLDASGLSADERERIHVELEPGAPESLLADYAAVRAIDLVIVGSHGRGALLNALIGSTAKEILAAAPCDVLVVREAPV